MPVNKDIGAIILAGGKSTRMKTEKGLVLFKGKPLVLHVIDAVKKITDHILLVTANADYLQFGYPCYEDELKEKGSLGGIYTGLYYSTTQKNLVVACDMPFLSEKLLKELTKKIGEEDVLLSEHSGFIEPLCSVYDRNCVLHIRQLLENNQLKIRDALAGLKTKVISFDAELWFKGNEFANLNSIEELRKYSSEK